MQHFLQSADLLPLWSAGTEQRLWMSMLLATAVLLFAISWLRLPSVSESPPLKRLVVELVRSVNERVSVPPIESPIEPPPTEIPEKVVETLTEPVNISPPAEAATEETSDVAVEADAIDDPKTDWQQESLAVVQSVLDENSRTFSVNPNFDKKRRAASETFRPSEAPVKKEIWDNVEKDYLGRTIWRNGGCYKILDNPSAVYRWVFETFERYMTYCDGSNEEYLIEFDEIPDRYQYLEDEFANGVP